MATTKIIATPHLVVRFRVCPVGERPAIVSVDWRRVDEALAEWKMAGIPVESLGLENEVGQSHEQTGTAADIQTTGAHPAVDG